MCSGSGFGCAPPLLARVLGRVCACVPAPLVPCNSWLGCAVWVCVLRLGFRLCPATPVFLGCVCACGRTPLLLRHSWLGCVVRVCVLGLGFRLHPASPGWGVGVCVCLCAHSACTPPLLAGVCGVGVCVPALVSAAPRLSWLGCWGVRVCVRAPLVPRHSLLGCALWVCVRGLGFWLRPASPGWGVGVCVCLCARPCCNPPLLAGVCGVGVCALARVSAAPRHSWLGCWPVSVLACALRLYPATPGWGVGVCVCLFARSACTPPLLPGVCGVGVCASARVLAAPRNSWLGCWGLCAFAYALLFYSATPGWGVRRGRVCLGSGFGCAPPLLAGASGFVCPCVRAPLVPRHSWLGFVVCGCGVACHLLLCGGSLRVARAARVCGSPWPLLLGTCSCALVLAGSVLLRRASWPRVVRSQSGRSRCSGWLFWRCGAFPHSEGLRRRLYLVAARGTRRLAGNRAHCACRWPPVRQGLWARSASYPFRAPRWGCPWRVPPASVLGCVRCGGWRVWTRSLTRPASRTVRLPAGDSAGAPGLFCVDAHTVLFRSEDATHGCRVCVRVRALLGRVGRAGLPGALWCASPFPVAGLGALVVCSAPSGLGLPFLPSVRLSCFWRSLSSGPGCLGPWRIADQPFPPLFPFFSSPTPPLPPFSSLCAPLLSLAFRVFRPGVP